jgi:hypothetical protein
MKAAGQKAPLKSEPLKYNVGDCTIGFPQGERFRLRFSNKEDFIKEMNDAFPNLKGEQFDKVLEMAWNDAYPKSEKD